LQRAFRDFYRERPSYAMLPVQEAHDLPAGPGVGTAIGDAAGTAAAGVEVPSEWTDADLEATASLLPPGQLESIRIIPAEVRLECGSTKRIRALALDHDGRTLEELVVFEWSLPVEVGTLTATAAGGRAEARLDAAPAPAAGIIEVVARSGEREARATAPVEVVDDLARSRPDEGIPEPEFVSHAGAPWRSRMSDGRWQVNTAHRDYAAIAESPTLKLRYLAMLFAKEIVIRSHSDPRLDPPLEQLVEVAAFADRSLTAKRPGRPARTRGASTAAESAT
jgi:hypothetical protein